MKILIDTIGGDTAPVNMVAGAILAMRVDPTIKCVFVGDENYARPVIEEAQLADRAEYIHTTEGVSFDEDPTKAVRRPGTSLMMALERMKSDEDCKGFVSAGSTGALLAGSFFKIGRIEGISRPTLCPWIPTSNPDVKVVLADAGANMDCKPLHLVHFSLMTHVYSKLVLGVENPRLALVNVGTEDNKGNELTMQTFQILRALHERGAINFVGNMEARDAFTGDFDIIICDGFVGNVLLKTAEGAFKLVGKQIKNVCKKSILTKFGALFIRKGLTEMKHKFNEDGTGGSPLLGIKKPVIKAHGNSSPRAFKNAVLAAAVSARNDVSAVIRDLVEEHKDLIAEMTAEKVK
jgi:glycerol-3-phosphate acyltransferase PlsX